MTASAPQAIAFEMSPPVRMPPSAITFTYLPVSSRCCTRAAAASEIAVACGTPTPRTPRVVHAWPGPTPTRTPSAPVRIRWSAVWYEAHPPTSVGIGSSAMNSLRFSACAVRGHVLGRDDGSLDDEDVEPGLERELVVLAHPLRGQRAGGEHARALDLLDPLGDQLRLDGPGVDLLQPARRPVLRKLRDPLELRVGVLVARVDALEVEDAEAAELAERDRRRRRDDTVHRRGEQRQLEQVRAELPADVDVLRIPRPAAGDDRDVVEPVRLPRLLASTDLYVHRLISHRCKTRCVPVRGGLEGGCTGKARASSWRHRKRRLRSGLLAAADLYVQICPLNAKSPGAVWSPGP